MKHITVIKRNGSTEPWDETKLQRWAKFSASVGADWKLISDKTVEMLPDNVTTEEIHETMIKVCIEQKSLPYSRAASRLQFGTIRKSMKKHGIPYKGKFKDIYETLLEKGIWNKDTMPEYSEQMEDTWNMVYPEYFECWQVMQFMDKYALKDGNDILETPHIAAMGIGLAIHGDTKDGHDLARNIANGKVNMPTPVLNGCRNGDFDTISCCVIRGGDSVDSIGVATHVAYKMTAKKAGIGVEFETRSTNDKVKGGRVKHLGKLPIYSELHTAVKMFTQQSRGGSATVTYRCIDPQIEELIYVKSQRTPENRRIDKIDYSFAYNDAFIQALIHDEDWHLFSVSDSNLVHQSFILGAESYNKIVQSEIARGVKHTTMRALDLVKIFLRTRQETGRIYAINLTRTNEHTPFLDTIYMSNLCQEIALPNKPYRNMQDLYSEKSLGETAFCSIGAINVQRMHPTDHKELARLMVVTINKLIDKCHMFADSMYESITRRRSIAVGMTGLAGYLYAQGLDYDGTTESLRTVSDLAERHYYYLLKASQDLVEQGLYSPCVGINTNWLPIDTMKFHKESTLDWGSLRDKPRANSVLVAHMPAESSALFSNSTNGLYPVRQQIIDKTSRYGSIQYIAPRGIYMTAWETSNKALALTYAAIQDFTDQSISADYYCDYTVLENGKVKMSQLIDEFIFQSMVGCKSMYYVNSNDDNGGSLTQQLETQGCESGACSL